MKSLAKEIIQQKKGTAYDAIDKLSESELSKFMTEVYQYYVSRNLYSTNKLGIQSDEQNYIFDVMDYLGVAGRKNFESQSIGERREIVKDTYNIVSSYKFETRHIIDIREQAVDAWARKLKVKDAKKFKTEIGWDPASGKYSDNFFRLLKRMKETYTIYAEYYYTNGENSIMGKMVQMLEEGWSFDTDWNLWMQEIDRRLKTRARVNEEPDYFDN